MYAKALDETLTPLGFTRKGDEWTRVRGDMSESVLRNASWSSGGVTVQFSMKDIETEKLYLEILGPSGAIQMPSGGQSIGGLIDGYSRWWKADEPDGPQQMAEAVVKYGLPWFDRVRTLEDQAAKWYNRDGFFASSKPWSYSPGVVGLALTLYRMGELEQACWVVSRPAARFVPGGTKDVEKVREWLGCAAPASRDGGVSGRQAG